MKSTITFMTTEDDKVNVIIEQEKVKHRNHGKSRVPYISKEKIPVHRDDSEIENE